MLAEGDENVAGGIRLETGSYHPSEHLSRVVVDDGMQVSPGAVQQLQNGHVDMPKLVGPSRAHAFGGPRRMDTNAKATPTTLSNQSCPRGDECEDSTDSLSVQTERSQRHVRQFGIK